MTTPTAIVLGSALIAAAITGAQFVPRYQIVGTTLSAIRLDTRTGEMVPCVQIQNGIIVCRPY